MANKPLSINLLKKPNESFVDKFIHWALTVGRFVVIATEAIALCTFLYRFTLDRQLVDLHDAIKQKIAIVTILKDNENTYRDIQERLAFAASYSNTSTITTDNFVNIINLAPSDMVFTNIILTNGRLRIEATVQSVRSLSKFVQSLRNDPSIKTVSLDQIENKPSNASIIVSITAVLKDGEGVGQ